MTRTSRIQRFSFVSIILNAMKKVVIAIDGPAASGKSTTAKLLAKKLGLTPVDTGAMYRAVTLMVLESGIDPHNRDAVEKIAMKTQIIQKFVEGEVLTIVNGKDRSSDIRKPEVNKWVSLVSSYPGVRRALVQKQREMAKIGGVVIEGRDIGTVVVPDAHLKIFMIATPEERARRRLKELKEAGINVSFEDVLKDILQRDKLDSTRENSPLKKANDALVIDTTNLTIEEQVELGIQELKKLGYDP